MTINNNQMTSTRCFLTGHKSRNNRYLIRSFQWVDKNRNNHCLKSFFRRVLSKVTNLLWKSFIVLSTYFIYRCLTNIYHIPLDRAKTFLSSDNKSLLSGPIYRRNLGTNISDHFAEFHEKCGACFWLLLFSVMPFHLWTCYEVELYTI